MIDLTESEKEHFAKMDQQDEEEKKLFFSSNLNRKAKEIFFLYASIANPKLVDWKRLEEETGHQAVQRYLAKHPEEKEMFQRFCQKPAEPPAATPTKNNVVLPEQFPPHMSHIVEETKAAGLNLVAIVEPPKQISPVKNKNWSDMIMDFDLPGPSLPVQESLPQQKDEEEPEEEEEEEEEPAAEPEPEVKEESKRSPCFPPPPPLPSHEEKKLTPVPDYVPREEIQKMIRDACTPLLSNALQDILPGVRSTILQEVGTMINPIDATLKTLMEKMAQTDQTLKELLAMKQEQQTKPPVQAQPAPPPPQFADPYLEDKHRIMDLAIAKSRIEGFELPSYYNARTADLYEKALVRERLRAIEEEKDYIADKESLVVGIAHGFEHLAKCIGLGTETFRGFGDRVTEFVDQEQGLRKTLKYMYRDEKTHSTSDPKYSLVSPLLRLMLKTVRKNETPHVASALKQGVEDIKGLWNARGEEKERQVRRVKRKLRRAHQSLTREVAVPVDDGYDDQDEPLKERDGTPIFVARDSDQEIEDNIRRSYQQAGVPVHHHFQEPEEFVEVAKERIRRGATSDRARQLLDQYEEKKGNSLGFRTPGPGEKPKLDDVSTLPIDGMFNRVVGSDGLLEGFTKGMKAVQNIQQKNQKQAEQIKQSTAEIYLQ